MESKALLLLMRRGARLLAMGFFLGAVLGFSAARVQTPVYEAKTQVLISRARQQSNTDVLPLGEEQLVSTNIQLVKSRPVLDSASAQLGVKVKADNIAVSAIPNTLIIQIKVQDSNPQRGADIANTLVQVLIGQNEQLVAERYAAFESSLNDQINQIQTQMSDLQAQINRINDASIADQLAQVTQQIDQLKAELAALEAEINSYPTLLSDMQRVSLGEKQARLEQLRSLLDIYQQIQTNLIFLGKPGQTELTRADPRLRSLQSTMDLYQELYLNLVNSRETLNLDRAQNTPNLTQINPAMPPKDPVRPLPLLYTLLGAVVGFFLSATAVLTLEHLDDSLRTVTQAEEALHLPVLGMVSENSRAGDELVTRRDPASSEAEAFRTLGVNLEFAIPPENVHSLLVIHADPQESKTAIAANLGIVQAQRGKRVALLDGDLSRPHLHRLFGMGEGAGMANILEKDVDIKSLSCPVEGVAGMTLIPGGAVTEPLASWRDGEKWRDVLIRLHGQADLVIVDGPPVETASAQRLASQVDAVLLLVNQGKTRIDVAATARRQMQLVGARVAGIVMYHAPLYRTIQLRNFSLAGIRKKGGSPKSSKTLDEETIALP